MMTDQQREAAARELCRLRGVDPDKSVTRDGVEDWYEVCPRWENAAAEIRRHEQMQAAIACGLKRSNYPPEAPTDRMCTAE